MSFNYLPLLPVFESLGDWIAKGAASNNSKKEISLLWCWQVDPLYETSSKMKLALKRCCLWKWSSHLLWDSGVRAEIAPGGTNWAGPVVCVICLCVCVCMCNCMCLYLCTHLDTPVPETGPARLPAFIQGNRSTFQDGKHDSQERQSALYVQKEQLSVQKTFIPPL